MGLQARRCAEKDGPDDLLFIYKSGFDFGPTGQPYVSLGQRPRSAWDRTTKSQRDDPSFWNTFFPRREMRICEGCDIVDAWVRATPLGLDEW